MPHAMQNDGMMQELINKEQNILGLVFHTWDVTKRPPLKESRPEIPTEKGKGRDTSCEDPLRSPMLLLYRNDETTEP